MRAHKPETQAMRVMKARVTSGVASALGGPVHFNIYHKGYYHTAIVMYQAYRNIYTYIPIVTYTYTQTF